MRADKANHKNNTDNCIKLKNIGLSIMLHVVVAALVLGVGTRAEQTTDAAKDTSSPMKAVLWVSTGAKKKWSKQK